MKRLMQAIRSLLTGKELREEDIVDELVKRDVLAREDEHAVLPILESLVLDGKVKCHTITYSQHVPAGIGLKPGESETYYMDVKNPHHRYGSR